ncbi:MAG: Peptidoglycan glycosyltransferase [Planctomycetaceae bacterium]|nr:Peptidoglycan glycosyltransferase [Planctomycetaceae bacterium]
MSSQPNIAQPAAWRHQVVIACFALIGAAICVRLVQLQGFSHTQFAQKVAQQSVVREDVSARPGDLFDRHGRLLATTITSRSLFLVPSKIENPWEISNRISQALDLDGDQLFERLGLNQTKHFLWVKRRLSATEVERIKELNLAAGIFGFREEYLRQYPQGPLAAQVIGLRDIDGRGQGGVEQSLNSILAGRNGWRELIRDAQGRVIDIQPLAEESPQPGRSVTLTLDAVVQLYAERELDTLVEQFHPKGCCAVVLSAETGEVLAMASRPTFDPNHPEKASDAAWKNRVISDIYEPGSTFKPCIVAWALQKKLLERDEIFNCENGEYRMGRRILHDHHRYGNLSVTDILVKSSNIGMAKIGERLTNAGLFSAASNFGFGRTTGIELPTEEAGLLRPLAEWTSYSTGSIPMGQELSATPLQIITAYGALANRGRLNSPHLVLRIGDDALSPPPPVFVSQIVKPDIAEWLVQEVLTEVIHRGTGRKAQLQTYQIFGKTGTAQKLDPDTGLYSKKLNISSFVCGGPADKPKVLVLVTVDEPTEGGDGFGGTVAAPAASKILEKTLQQLRTPVRPTLRSVFRN